MIFIKPYSNIILIAILILILATSALFSAVTTQLEGFELVPLITDPATKQVLTGYYQVDTGNMAMLPYGFVVDPCNNRQIIPVTKVNKSMLIPNYKATIPPPGNFLPDGSYFMTDSSLAILPPNMMPNVKSIDFSGNPPELLIYYNKGYMSETEYYQKQYKPLNYPKTLPKQVYYADPSHTLISFLQYGQIPDTAKGYGQILNPKLNLSTTNFNYITSNYRDISNNYDTKFHDDIDIIQKQNNLTELSFGQTRVKDQNGNIIIIPSAPAQDIVTYYHPGEFPFGASNYVPNYEDSIYLSSIGNRTMFGNTAATSNCGDMCKAYNDFKATMDKLCINIQN